MSIFTPSHQPTSGATAANDAASFTAIDGRTHFTAKQPGQLRVKSVAVLAMVTLVGLVGFFWPFLAQPGSTMLGHANDAPWLFALLLPLLLVLVLTEISDGGLDSRGVAMLGVLSAIAASLRPFGAGAVGFEPMWVVIILGGRALGPGFGFLLGNIALFASALLTGGIGPWLPFQMIVAGWMGFFAGCLPRARGKAEVAVLTGYAIVAALVYGALLNLWFWPWAASTSTAISFIPGDPVLENLQRWLLFNITTSLGYDIPRAVVVSALVILAAGPILAVIRRATRKAAFAQPIVFAQATDSSAPH